MPSDLPSAELHLRLVDKMRIQVDIERVVMRDMMGVPRTARGRLDPATSAVFPFVYRTIARPAYIIVWEIVRQHVHDQRLIR